MVNNELIVQTVSEKFSGVVVEDTTSTQDILTLSVAADKVIEVLSFLKEDPSFSFHFLTDITAVHYPEQEKDLTVVYHLHNWKDRVRLRVKTAISTSNPVIASATILWPGANWMERETYDFFGIQFQGHPDLRRILNVDEMTAFPMRREFPLEDPNRVDKKDEFFGR